VLDDDFQAWLNGQAPEKDHLWESWLLENPYAKVEVDKARALLYALQFKKKQPDVSDVDQQWRRLKSSMASVRPMYETDKLNRFGRLFSVLKLMAAACLLLAGIFLSERFVLAPRRALLAAKPVELKSYNGEQRTIRLTDGTSVRLNAGSSITYPKHFAKDLREVTLVGEAFFDVTPMKDAPFIIHTGKLTTRVLGTSFNIRAYPENEAVLVAVVEGKVKVSANNASADDKNSVCITKKEMATFQKEQQQLSVSPYEEAEQIGWKDGVLYFEKADFASIVKKLERWYGVKFKVSKDLKIDPAWRFSGSFQDKPLDYILNAIRHPHLFSFTIKDNVVKLQ